MLRTILLALLLAIPVLSHDARAQTVTHTYDASVEGSGYEDMTVGESRDVPCGYSYAPAFYSNDGVEFEGQMFMSEWRSERSDFPLPAWNWYYAYPVQTLVSNNGKYRWEDAGIQVHCRVYRTLYVLTRRAATARLPLPRSGRHALRRDLAHPQETTQMKSDDLDFDFTEDEMYRALRLVVSEAEAREQATAFAAANAPGMDWATSEHALLLLSLGSESARTRVDRIRGALQDSRRETWLREQHAERVGEADALARWADVLAAEDKDWTWRLSELRRQLQEEGKLGGGPERD